MKIMWYDEKHQNSYLRDLMVWIWFKCVSVLIDPHIFWQMFGSINFQQNIITFSVAGTNSKMSCLIIDQLLLFSILLILLVCLFYLRVFFQRQTQAKPQRFTSTAEPQCPLALWNYFSNQSMLDSQANTWLLNGSLPLWPSYPRVILREISFPHWIYDKLLPQHNTNSLTCPS